MGILRAIYYFQLGKILVLKIFQSEKNLVEEKWPGRKFGRLGNLGNFGEKNCPRFVRPSFRPRDHSKTRTSKSRTNIYIFLCFISFNNYQTIVYGYFVEFQVIRNMSSTFHYKYTLIDSFTQFTHFNFQEGKIQVNHG